VLTNDTKAKREEQRKFLKGGLREAAYFGIEAIGPDVNRSDLGWTIDNGKLRYGLVSVTGMGTGLAQQIIENRHYSDYDEFIEKIPTGFGADKMVALAQAGAFDDIEDRELLLSLTRQWAENVVKLKIKMTCGDVKHRTVKLKPDDDISLEEKVEKVIDDLECPNHPDATVVEATRLDDLYPVARYFKDHQNGHVPDIVSTPTRAEISDMELNALNVSLMQSAWLLQFKPFLDERIYTDAEIEELPRHPSRKGKKHGNWCKCSACEKAQCVVGGEIVHLKVIKTTKGDWMAFADLAYETNQYSCTFFPSQYKEYEEILKGQSLVMIAGYKDDRGQIVALEMSDVFTIAEEQGWKPAT
jgi:DNA polymerase III alpha subunit